MKKVAIISGVVVALAALGTVLYLVLSRKLKDSIVTPYIAHQKPRIDPHVPGSVALADKLDEVIFDGLFNVSANPSGIVYEDGLGTLVSFGQDKSVTVRLNPKRAWHRSYNIAMEKDKITLSAGQAVRFTAEDLRFTLRRIRDLGSLSPDHILLAQALHSSYDFEGPDEDHEIVFRFRDDRIWTESDIKEILSFKILPAGAGMKAKNYTDGTGPYLFAGEYEKALLFQRNPSENSGLSKMVLRPYIDNSTFTTELKNRRINSVLNTPFGSLSPILEDTTDYFYKSSIATCFFAILFNCERLNRDQRYSLRALIDNNRIMKRFFKQGTMQQRHIANYKGPMDNYGDYLNHSVFPTTSYYVEEEVVFPLKDKGKPELGLLPDTVIIQTCLNYGYREELSELAAIMNSPSLLDGRIRVQPVSNAEIKKGNYDAVLVPISGYRSNFLFDLYDVFLREPNFAVKKISLKVQKNKKGEWEADSRSFMTARNFFRLGLGIEENDKESMQKLLELVYGFMSTSEIGDKQAYAQYLDELDQEMALGSWLFSLPSLAYFSTQFDKNSIDLYGIASQLSTIEKWQEHQDF